MDIWAAGVIMFILLTGEHPFEKDAGDTEKYLNAMKDVGWHRKIACSEYVHYVRNRRNRLAKDLLIKLCNPNTLGRYSAKEALQHPWITE